jgi:hypothetical protein
MRHAGLQTDCLARSSRPLDERSYGGGASSAVDSSSAHALQTARRHRQRERPGRSSDQMLPAISPSGSSPSAPQSIALAGCSCLIPGFTTECCERGEEDRIAAIGSMGDRAPLEGGAVGPKSGARPAAGWLQNDFPHPLTDTRQFGILHCGHGSSGVGCRSID